MRIFVPLIFVVVGACYRYVPAGDRAAVSGTQIEVELTDAGVVDLARLLGPNTTMIRGRLRSAESDTMHLAVSSITKRRGDEEFWSGEALAIPRSDVAAVRVRRVSATRTTLLAAGVAAGSLLLRGLVAQITDSGNSGPPRPLPGQ